MNAYNHNQSSSSTAWTIIHNLNTPAVAIDVFVDVAGTLTKILPASVVADNDNQVTVTFSSAQFGRARVIG